MLRGRTPGCGLNVICTDQQRGEILAHTKNHHMSDIGKFSHIFSLPNFTDDWISYKGLHTGRYFHFFMAL